MEGYRVNIFNTIHYIEGVRFKSRREPLAAFVFAISCAFLFAFFFVFPSAFVGVFLFAFVFALRVGCSRQ